MCQDTYEDFGIEEISFVVVWGRIQLMANSAVEEEDIMVQRVDYDFGVDQMDLGTVLHGPYRCEMGTYKSLKKTGEEWWQDCSGEWSVVYTNYEKRLVLKCSLSLVQTNVMPIEIP